MNINWKQIERKQEADEEKVNSILHIFGVVLAFLGLINIIIHASTHHNLIHFMAFFLYGFGICFLFLMSSLYHGTQNEKYKIKMAKMDYIAISVMIACAYSPILLILLERYSILSWGLFILIWVMAIVNSVSTFIWVKQISIFNILIYMCMSLISLTLIPFAYRVSGLPIILYTTLGGLVYIAGVYFFGIAKFKYHHAIWHVFVLVGSIIHYFTIISFI